MAGEIAATTQEVGRANVAGRGRFGGGLLRHAEGQVNRDVKRAGFQSESGPFRVVLRMAPGVP